MFLHRWEVSVRINLPLFSTVVPAIIAGTTVENKGKLILTTGKRPLGRPRHRWEDNIRMDFKDICVNTRNWVDLTRDRDYWRALVNAALDFWVL